MIQIALTSSTPVDSSRFEFNLNGRTLPPTSVIPTTGKPEDGGLRTYTAALSDSFPPGTNTLTFIAYSQDGRSSISKLVRFRVAGASELTLGEVINYPNPFEAATAFHYTLTQNVDALDVKIFTISGRQIRDMVALGADLSGGTHMLPWDGTDADGDAVSNGTYLYKIVARKAGQTLEKLGKMVRMR